MAKTSLKKWLFTIALIVTASHAYGQDVSYTTHTEAGVLTYTAPFFEGMTFTGRTFHGVRLKRNWQLGLSAGLDKYTSFWVLPLSTGIRYVPHPDATNSLYTGVEVGYGFPWLNKKTRDEQSFSGGFVIQPTIGLRIKGGVTLSVSYQQQRFASQLRFPNNRVDDYYTFHRMALRLGLML